MKIINGKSDSKYLCLPDSNGQMGMVWWTSSVHCRIFCSFPHLLDCAVGVKPLSSVTWFYKNMTISLQTRCEQMTLYLWERVPRITRGSNARFCIGGRNLVDLGAVLIGSRLMFSCWSRGLSYLGLSLLPLLNRGSISRRPISFAVGPLDPILTTFPDHTPISPKNLKYLHCKSHPTWVQICNGQEQFTNLNVKKEILWIKERLIETDRLLLLK
jgi:hypothetical protein